MTTVTDEMDSWRGYTPTFELGEDETGGLCFFWTNPWTGNREKLASLWWPEHPEEATAMVEQLFAKLRLTLGSTAPLAVAARELIASRFENFRARMRDYLIALVSRRI